MTAPTNRIAAQDVAALILRVMVGVVFIYHGYPKLFGGIEDFAGNLEKMNVPAPMVSAYLAAITEFVGGVFILAGALTRLWCIPMIITMVVAIVMVHSKAFGMQHGGMEYTLVLIAMLSSILLTGPGMISVSGLIAGSCCRKAANGDV